MSKHASHGKRKKQSRPVTRTADGAVYIGLMLIGAFAVFLGFLVTGGQWQPVAIGYVIAMAILVNYYAVRAYIGRSLAPWQASLARLPLRCVGFGRRGGKPLEAARGDAQARLMIMVSVAASVVVITGLSLLLIGR